MALRRELAFTDEMLLDQGCVEFIRMDYLFSIEIKDSNDFGFIIESLMFFFYLCSIKLERFLHSAGEPIVRIEVFRSSSTTVSVCVRARTHWYLKSS